ncbi:MAG: DUF6655 family protein [Planctomycetaceae bacterium]
MQTIHFSMVAIFSLLIAAGCGSTQQRSGTEQLLLSDSVDRTIDQLDFTPLSGRKVYLDTTYIQPVKGVMFVNADYIISALRHKLTVTGCAVQDSKTDADYILEARVGALGTDSLEVTYGLPASNALSTAANVMTGVPAVPSIPELSVGKRNAALSTSKIIVYAYHRETKTPVWQSGTAIAKSDAKDTWLLGAGPLQRGSIYRKTTFAGIPVKGRFGKRTEPVESSRVTMAESHQFTHPAVLEQQLAKAKEAEEALKVAKARKAEDSGVVPASHTEEKKE